MMMMIMMMSSYYILCLHVHIAFLCWVVGAMCVRWSQGFDDNTRPCQVWTIILQHLMTEMQMWIPIFIVPQHQVVSAVDILQCKWVKCNIVSFIHCLFTCCHGNRWSIYSRAWVGSSYTISVYISRIPGVTYLFHNYFSYSGYS